MVIASLFRALGISLFVTTLLTSGCERSSKAPPTATETQEQKTAVEKPKEPLIKKANVKDWCPEHSVPESICTRCNSALIADFKQKGDWCAKHDLPDSQCLVCHPELKAKFEEMQAQDDATSDPA